MISNGFNPSGILIAILAYAIPVAIILFASYWVIRSAVGSALRRHQIWLDAQKNILPGPTGAIGNIPHT
ncbi:hypothetical protein [Herbiconiux daphne]|uniref:Uncharacterized protein n=1 Tax=Herbiconiux daphne TaxID=2970914 RepID=A0ABT2H789_9MICO|nr:hypothetical protein [Herbiconiux daphne]MCS5735801.1 hypothetical protein [Herbiconiux daphne]